jgi:hypothetical protein
VTLGESADPRDVGGGDHLRSFATIGQSLHELGFEVLHVDFVLYPTWHIPIDWSLRLTRNGVAHEIFTSSSFAGTATAAQLRSKLGWPVLDPFVPSLMSVSEAAPVCDVP